MRQITPGLGHRVGVMVLFCISTTVAFAQANPSESLKETLKKFKPAAGTCTKKDANKPKPIAPPHVDEMKPDLSCAIEPLDLAKNLHKAETLLVDTRSGVDFVNYHVDGAMNISPTALRSKTFLFDKAVVLMGNGKAERELYIECNRLKSNGFKKINVLRGGMPSWLTSGQAVIGAVPNSVQLTRLTPSDLWIESQFESNLVLVTTSQKTMQKQLKGSILLSDDSPKAIQKVIEQRRKQSKPGFLAAVIIVADSTLDFQRVSQAIKSIPLLVYYESADAFSHYIVQQNAVWAAQARGPKQPLGCGR